MNTKPAWQAQLEHQIGADVIRLNHLSGGDFADAYQAVLSSGEALFVKTHYEPIKAFFTTEAQGLTWLRDANAVNVPQVLAISDDPPMLALEWIEQGRADATTEEEFGRELAALHQISAVQFGRPDKRNTGSQGLPNSCCASWSHFYAQNRLLPLAEIAHQRKALPNKLVQQIESIASRLEQLGGPEVSPVLLHGDLWAGNRIVDKEGHSWLIDPAAHYSHFEFDLAMMRLFGGFSERCFDSYAEVAKLPSDYMERVALHQIAPLVVHAIKFGGHYVQATAKALRFYQ